MSKQQGPDYVFGFGGESKAEDEDGLHVDGDIVCSGNIKGPSIEEIHKKIEEGQMSVDELESAVHYIVNMELKHIVIDIQTDLTYAGSFIAAYTPSRVSEPEHILMEMDLMSNMIGKAISDAAYSITQTFNDRLEKHGYDS